MSAWFTYIKERFPLPVYFLLCGGIMMSSSRLTNSPVLSASALITFLGLMMFFAELRLMDEFKDYKKDLIAHPQRPLPRGLLQVSQVKNVIHILLVLMLIFALVSGVVLNVSSGFAYALVTLYLYGMFREFFVSEWLETRMILYAISHQVILLGLVGFSVSSFDESSLWSREAILYGCVVLGTFFNYEVGRKLDPKALPILRTYRVVYGETKTFILMLCLSIFGSISAIMLDFKLGCVMIGLLTVGLITVLGAFFKNWNYKLAETFATLGLLFGIWFGFIRYYF